MVYKYYLNSLCKVAVHEVFQDHDFSTHSERNCELKTQTSICEETISHYLWECLGNIRKPQTISGHVKYLALPLYNHKMHSSGSTGFEGNGFMDPRVADVTFSTVTLNSFWELAAPSQTMHGSMQSIFIETPVKEEEHDCKNNPRNKPATSSSLQQAMTHLPSTVYTSYSVFFIFWVQKQ